MVNDSNTPLNQCPNVHICKTESSQVHKHVTEFWFLEAYSGEISTQSKSKSECRTHKSNCLSSGRNKCYIKALKGMSGFKEKGIEPQAPVSNKTKKPLICFTCNPPVKPMRVFCVISNVKGCGSLVSSGNRLLVWVSDTFTAQCIVQCAML